MLVPLQCTSDNGIWTIDSVLTVRSIRMLSLLMDMNPSFGWPYESRTLQ